MKMEIFPQEGGFRIIFLDTSLATVAKIKRFALAMLSGMSYQFGEVKIEEEDNLFFFDLVSSTDSKKLLNDLFCSLDKVTRELVKEENHYS